MGRKGTRIVETLPGVHVPKGWRSSFLRQEIRGSTGDYAEILGRHVVPEQTISVVRRIEAEVFRRDEDDMLDVVWNVPDWWHNPLGVKPPDGEWDWNWNIGHVGVRGSYADLLPGDVIPCPGLGRIKDLLAPIAFDYCDGWQRLASWLHGPIHQAPARFFVQGPQVIYLVAIVTANPPSVNQPMPDNPFGRSFGSIEGIDVPAREILKSPHRWLTL